MSSRRSRDPLIRARAGYRMDPGLRRDDIWIGRKRLFLSRDRVAFVAAGDALHLLEEIVQGLVGGIRHLGEGAQEAVGPRQLEQRFLAILRRRRGDQNDVIEGL